LFAILARGGSKRLPGKNLLEVGGVSLLGRAIQCARACAVRLPNDCRVVVSTDDEDIANEARRWNAEIPFMRSPELASDTATSVAALSHLIDWYADRGEKFTEVALLQPTSPCRLTRDVMRCIDRYREDPAATCVSVSRHSNANESLRFELRDGTLHAPINTSSQSTDNSIVALNGAVYVCSPTWIQENESLCVSGRSMGIVVPAHRSIDVDVIDDLERARQNHAENVPWLHDHCFVIAEAGVNHNGCIDTARKLVEEAARAGADAIKFQTFSAERLATRSAPKAEYQKRNVEQDESQYAMLQRLELSPDNHRMLMKHCDKHNIRFLSSAFSNEDIDLLDELDLSAIKLGSAEITNHPLLAHAAGTLRPIILSTGCSWFEEVNAAIRVLKENGCADLVLLHCVSAYPAACEDVNLRAMTTLAHATQLPIGFSDHTEGIALVGAAVAMGARIIEKHFTLDRTADGPDHRASLEPAALKAMVETIRAVESALGDGIKRPTDSETNTRQVARRSLVAAKDLAIGTILRREHLTAKRPGTAIPPSEMERVLGQILVKEVQSDEPLTWSHLTPAEATT
jgi:N-acetylneuraminate synthase/N,N'-diacetyllegionaminate synthase